MGFIKNKLFLSRKFIVRGYSIDLDTYDIVYQTKTETMYVTPEGNYFWVRVNGINTLFEFYTDVDSYEFKERIEDHQKDLKVSWKDIFGEEATVL